MVPKPPKISIFWYPKGGKPAAKQPSWSQDAKMQPKQHSRKVASQQLSSQAGAKMPRYQDSSRARSILSIFLASPRLQGISKINHFGTQIPRWLDITITSDLLYKSYVFIVPKPP